MMAHWDEAFDRKIDLDALEVAIRRHPCCHIMRRSRAVAGALFRSRRQGFYKRACAFGPVILEAPLVIAS